MPFYFKLPIYTDLTDSQMAVLDEPGPVAITGGPGTGKSVVSLWRHVRNHDIGKKKSFMVCFTKTLEIYLASCAAAENQMAGRAVTRTNIWNSSIRTIQDEIIIDEAQDVPEATQKSMMHFGKVVSYGADDQQILYPDRATTQAQLLLLYPNNKDYELDENFRNSYEIMQFTKAALPNRLISGVMMNILRLKRSFGIKPKCMIVTSQQKQNNTILDIIAEFQSENHNIGVLLPIGPQVDAMYEFLKAQKIVCTKYRTGDEEITALENVHVTTFKSSKGIEFDTVILPDFEHWKYNFVRYDRSVKENDYYVAFTRAKRNLYLISTTNNIGINPATFETEKVK
jgi:superfamily I DNA/RNA helicase